MNPLILALILALAVPAGAENFYEYPQHVQRHRPILFTSPGEIEIPFEVAEYGPVGPVYTKNCAIYPDLWDGSEPPRDRFVTIYFAPANLTTGKFRVVYGDNHPGRTYQLCLRLMHQGGHE